MKSSLSAYVSRNRWGGACIVRSINSRFAVQSSRAAARDVLRVIFDSYILRKCWIQSSWSIHCVLKHFNLKQLGKIWFQITHVSELLVARLRLLDQLRWVVTMNSTLLSDNLGLKHFNFKFVILHSPRQECSRTRSAVLLPDHCLHSTEFPTRQ